MTIFSRLTPLLLIAVSLSAHANLSTDLDTFFDGLGMTSNTTAPNVYQGQQAGFYTGGSLYARSRVRDTQFASIQLPSMRAGCGGIDVFTGGFSFIDGDQLVNLAKNVMNNATGYAFHLAMATISPMMESKMAFLNKWASDINRFNMNSCEASAALVGSVWAKDSIASQRICETIGSSEGIFYDRVRARHQCGAGGARTQTLTDYKKDPKWQDTIAINTNVTWAALQKNAFLSADKTLAEFFMSLSGSIILKQDGNDDSPQQKIMLAPLGQDRNLLKALLKGGKVEHYKCADTNACLDVALSSVTIDANKALDSRVQDLLLALVAKVKADSRLDASDISFLNSTAIPILKLLTVELAYTKSGLLTDVSTYAELISLDILQQYITENIRLVKTSVQQLPSLSDTDLQMFDDQLRDTLADIKEMIQESKTTMLSIHQLIARSRALEQSLAGDLSADLANTAAWDKGH